MKSHERLYFRVAAAAEPRLTKGFYMYTHAKSRRPWRGSATVSWVPDKMVRPQFRPIGIRGDGNDQVIYKTARTKQRRLDDWLARMDTGEWDE